MNALVNVLPLFLILFICTLCGYSMMNYRVSSKSAYRCFAAVTALCLTVNSAIVIKYGVDVLKPLILFTIGLPYFALILIITKDRFSQTVFNFWLWINIYEIIADFSGYINDVTFKNYGFLTAVQFILFCLYFILYQKVLKKPHKSIMEKTKVNWWMFTFIPMFFTILIAYVNYSFGTYKDFTKHYTILLIIHSLMFLVYILIFYTFKTAYESMEKQSLAQSLKEQIRLQKRQYGFYLQREEMERIFRHDARHRDAILLSLLESGSAEEAKEMLKKEMSLIQTESRAHFCDNKIINAVLFEYSERARKKNIEFSVKIRMPDAIFFDEAEFCVLLSNLLENSVEAAKTYIGVRILPHNNQLSISVKNDYYGEIKKDLDGNYVTTKKDGAGLGLKSVAAIIKDNGGLLRINEERGTFEVLATLKNYKKE